MSSSFSRQVGHESGVQLNPLRDRSELPTQSIADQVAATMMRATRGRIDKAFKVAAFNARTKLGNGETMRSSALNEAYVHTFEALDNGVYEFVVSRLVSSAAKIKWLVCKHTPGKPQTESAAAVPEKFTFEVSETEPAPGFLFALKHLECFNDGIKVAIHAEDDQVGGLDQPVDMLTLRVLDKDDNKLYEYTGSLKSTSTDDFGEPNWLPDLVANRTDSIELLCSQDGAINPDSACYGNDENGRAKWVESGVLVCFEEGGALYSPTDLIAARKRLQKSPHNFGYIGTGGSQSVAVLTQLAQLAFETNTQMRFDVSGKLEPDEVITFMEQLNPTSMKEAHLLHAFWFSAKSADPTGINSKDFFGVATLNIAYACARNAQKNSKGFAPKHFPIAGKDWPISRRNVTQVYTCEGPELSKLAKAKVNVCCWEEYDGGGRYVFRDSITCAPVDNALKKLIAVVDMSCHTDDAVTRFSKAALQKPMSVSVKSTNDFLQEYFDGAEHSGWIVPASSPSMGGLAAKWTVAPNEAQPYSHMDTNYSVRYEGTNRVTTVTQTHER